MDFSCGFNFLAVIGLADLFAVNSFKAFWSNFERMEGYVTLLHLGAYFVVMASVLKTKKLWNYLLATTVGASTIMAVYSFFQLAGKITINQGGVRVDGKLGNAAYLAIYMVFHIFFAGLLFVNARKNWQKILLGVVTLMNLVVLYFTATRGAILGLLGGTFITFVYLLFKSEKGAMIRKVALGGIIALVVFVGVFISIKDKDFVRNNMVLGRFASLSFSEIKTQGRYYIWPMAIKGFEEKPILGWGQEGFSFVFNKNYDPRMYNQEAWFDRVHSAPLDWLIAGGALGFVSYLSLFFFLVWYVFKKGNDNFTKPERAVMLGLISAYFFNNIFIFDQISSYILFFTVLAFMHFNSLEVSKSWWDRLAQKLSKIFNNEKRQPVLEAMILIVMVGVACLFVFMPWRQNKNLITILRAHNGGQIGEIADYKKLFDDYGVGFSESLEHISQAVISIASNPQIEEEFKIELFELVDGAFQKQIQKVPEDARYRLFYGIFLSRFGLYDKATEQISEAQKLSPRKQQIYFELVSNFLVSGKKVEAVAVAKEAYELEPNYTEAQMVYGLTLLAVGEETLSQQVLEGVPQDRILFDDRYINVLLSLKKFDQIINVAKKRIELDPANLQHRITLTAAFLQAERRVEAIQTLEEIIKIEPSFKEQGEYYISEIKAGRNP